MITLEKLWQQIRKLAARVDSTVSRAVLTKVDDAKKTQRLQLEILAEEVEEDIEHLQPFGVSFHPPDKSEVLALAVGGHRSHTVALCAQHPDKRPKSVPEDTGGLYTGAGEWRVYIDEEGVVHIGAKSGAEFIAQAKKTNTELDDTRKRLDDLTAAVNTLRMDFTTFANSHTHMVATAGSPAAQTGTAFPVTAPVPPVAPIQPPLGASKDVAATKGKVT